MFIYDFLAESEERGALYHNLVHHVIKQSHYLISLSEEVMRINVIAHE